MKNAIVRLLVVMLVTTLLGACATTPKNVQLEKRFFWPSEPDEPKIEWIATYFGDLDVKEKSFMTEIVGEESSVTFGRPISVAGDGEGRFVVSDSEKGGAFFFDLDKHKVQSLGGSFDAASFTSPSGVAVDGEGNFFVCDTGSKKIFVVNSENKLLRVMDISKHVESIGSPTVDRARARLIIPDPRGSKVLIFSLTGQLVSEVNGKGYFSYPNAVAVESDGAIVVADTFNATIVRFSAAGKFLSVVGKRGDSAGDLTLVTGVAVDSEDHIYATDGRLHNVTVFDKEGNTLMVVGATHSVRSGNIGRGGFLVPQGLSIDKNDRIYVADSLNRRVQVFQYLNERYLKEHPLPKPSVSPQPKP